MASGPLGALDLPLIQGPSAVSQCSVTCLVIFPLVWNVALLGTRDLALALWGLCHGAYLSSLVWMEIMTWPTYELEHNAMGFQKAPRLRKAREQTCEFPLKSPVFPGHVRRTHISTKLFTLATKLPCTAIAYLAPHRMRLALDIGDIIFFLKIIPPKLGRVTQTHHVIKMTSTSPGLREFFTWRNTFERQIPKACVVKHACNPALRKS